MRFSEEVVAGAAMEVAVETVTMDTCQCPTTTIITMHGAAIAEATWICLTCRIWE